MDGIFIGSIIFEFIGVFFRWLYFYITRKLSNKEAISFKRIWQERKNKDFKEEFEYGVSNIFLGMLITVLIIAAISLFI